MGNQNTKRFKVLTPIKIDGKEYKQGEIVFLDSYLAKRWDSHVRPAPLVEKRNKGTVAKRVK